MTAREILAEVREVDAYRLELADALLDRMQTRARELAHDADRSAKLPGMTTGDRSALLECRRILDDVAQRLNRVGKDRGRRSS